MALLWVDGFDDLATSAGTEVSTRLGRRYQLSGASSPNWKVGSGRLGGYTLYSDSGTAYVTLQNLGTTNDTIILGVAVYIEGNLTSATTVVALYDVDASGVNIRFNTVTGAVLVYRGGTYLGESNPNTVRCDAWYYLELKTKCHSSAGTVEVRIGGSTIVSLSGVNTQPGSHAYSTSLWLYPTSFTFDDLYICDASGSVNNDFLGNCRVQTVFPSADTASNDWTCSSGSDHYALVDEGQENDDTDYVSSGTSGHTDLWEYGDTSSLVTVFGAMVTTVLRDTVETPVAQVRSAVKSGTTTTQSAVHYVGTSDYTTRAWVVELDPDNSSAWTPTTINAAQFGIKVA